MTMSNPITVSEALDEWYTDVSPDLSQGDIVRFVPQGLIDAPMTICQPADNSAQVGKARYSVIDKSYSQRKGVFLHARFSMGLGIVVWPDCQIDKGKNQKRPEREWFAALAPVFPITKLDPSLHDNVRTFGRAQYFPLPAKADDLPESYVDLRYIWPVRYSLLADRITALTQEARQAFALHRFWFDTGAQINENINCPHCQKLIKSSSLLRFKEPE
jgi:hypothetical protein